MSPSTQGVSKCLCWPVVPAASEGPCSVFFYIPGFRALFYHLLLIIWFPLQVFDNVKIKGTSNLRHELDLRYATATGSSVSKDGI